MGKIAQMCSEPVVSQHNDLKGMLVPGNYLQIPWTWVQANC